MSFENEYYSEIELMSREKQKNYYNRKIKEQVKYAYDNSKAMRAVLDKAGISPSDIQGTEDITNIPVTTKDSIIESRKADPPWGGFLGVAQEKLPRIYMSPGPIYDVQSIDENFYLRWRRRLYAHGFRSGDRVVNTFSYHMTPAGHWFDEGLRQIGATVIPMGIGNTDLQVQVLRDMNVTGWVGVPSFLLKILQRAEEMGYSPKNDLKLRAISAGGEMGGAELRKILQEKYGFVSYDSYGTADLGLIAYECKEKKYMHIHEEVFVEIIDPETGNRLGPGEVGQVVVTPFDLSYPLLRFGTGDLSSYTTELCPCGRTSMKLTGIVGRIGDAVRVRAMFLHPKQVNQLLINFTEVTKYQIIVTRPGNRDELVLKIELGDENVDRSKLMSGIMEAFQNICRLTLDKIDFVPPGTINKDSKIINDKRKFGS